MRSARRCGRCARALKVPALLLAVFGVGGCGPEIVYDEYRELPGAWTYADSLRFDYEIADTARAYDLRLSLKHRDVFANQNLYARFVTVYPDGRRQSEPLSLELADGSGQWLGSCSGAVCELVIPLQLNTRYPAPGRYGLVLHQYMREASVAGVEGVGLRLVASEAQN